MSPTDATGPLALPVPSVHPDEVEEGWRLVVEEDDDGNPLRAVDLRDLTWRDRFHPEIRDTIRWWVVVELQAIGDIAEEATRKQFIADGRTIEEQLGALGPDVATMVAHVTRLHRLLGDGAL